MRVRVVFLLLLGTSLASATACSLNPQPLPPYTGSSDAGASLDANPFGGNSDASEDVGMTPNPPDSGATDSGTSADAGSVDGSSDAAEDGDTGGASDAGDDGDASVDATDDGGG